MTAASQFSVAGETAARLNDADMSAVPTPIDAQASPPASPPAAPHRASALDYLTSQPWAIRADMLETLRAIAAREGEGVEAVEARLGRPLQNARTVSVRDGVAVVPVTGPIFRYANMFTQVSGATSLDVLARDFQTALDDPQVSSVVLNIDSPGGQASGVAEFAQQVRAANKPVVAYVDGDANSAAYWIAAAAREVVVSKTGEVGSVGAVLALNGQRDPSRVEIVSSQSPHKRPDVTTDAGRSQLQARVDALAQVFIDDVAAYRGVSVQDVLGRFGQGATRLGAAAVEAGMADRVGTLEQVIAGLSGAAKGGPRMSASDDTTLPVLTLDQQIAALEADNPALVDAIRTSAHAAGAQAERQRIADVQAQAMPGHEALIAQMAADGQTTGPMAAVAVLAAERARSAEMATRLGRDAPAPVPSAPAPQPGADDVSASAPVEERCAALWARDARLHDEFPTLAAYTAYTRAIEGGRARVLHKG